MVIVTGASGFVGRYCVKALAQKGHEVLATARSEKGEEVYAHSKIPFVRVDLADAEDLKKLPKEGVDAVIHTAGLLSIDRHPPLSYFMSNSYATYNLADYCANIGVKSFIYTMTHSDVNRSGRLEITEETPRMYGGKETCAYIVSKVAAAEAITSISREYGFRVIILRLPGIRGWGSRHTARWGGNEQKFVFNLFIEKAMKSEPIEIWGHFETRRDLIYIKNVADGIVKALESKTSSGLYNLWSGQGLTIEDEAKAIIKAFCPPGRPSRLSYRPDIEEIRRRSYIFTVDKARRDFGYVPKFTYEEAMVDMKRDMERAGKKTPWDDWSLEDMEAIESRPFNPATTRSGRTALWGTSRRLRRRSCRTTDI